MLKFPSKKILCVRAKIFFQNSRFRLKIDLFFEQKVGDEECLTGERAAGPAKKMKKNAENALSLNVLA